MVVESARGHSRIVFLRLHPVEVRRLLPFVVVVLFLLLCPVRNKFLLDPPYYCVQVFVFHSILASAAAGTLFPFRAAQNVVNFIVYSIINVIFILRVRALLVSLVVVSTLFLRHFTLERHRVALIAMIVS